MANIYYPPPGYRASGREPTRDESMEDALAAVEHASMSCNHLWWQHHRVIADPANRLIANTLEELAMALQNMRAAKEAIAVQQGTRTRREDNG